MPAASPDAAPNPAKPAASPTQTTLHKALLWVPLALVVLSGILLAGLALQLRGNDIRAGRALTVTLAQLIEEQTGRTLQGVSQTLDQAATRIERLKQLGTANPATARLELRTLLSNRPYLRAIWMLDAQGVMTFDSDEGNIGIDLSDRDYFRFHLANPDAEFEIHAPVLSRTMGRWFISATQALRDENGHFAGIMVAAIEPLYFNQVWNVDLTRRSSLSITLLRRDATMLMRAPYDESVRDVSFAAIPLFHGALDRSPNGSYDSVSVVDNKLRMFAYRTISAQPNLVVTVGETVEHALESWRKFAIILAGGWLLSSTVLLALGFSLRREWRRRLTAEKDLQRAYERASTIMNHIVDGVISIDDSGIIKDFSQTAERIFGYGADEVIGQNIRMLMPEPYYSQHDDYIQAYMTTGLPKIIGKGREVLGRRKDGTSFPMDLSIAEIYGLDGIEFVGTVRDISERKAIEEQLRQAQKMEAVGQLTGGVAHDFNNMLTVIIGNADQLVESIPRESPLHRAAKLIMDSADASAKLVSRLLAFARRQPLEPRRVDVNQFLPKMRELLSRTLGENIEIGISSAAGAWEAMIDPAQLESSLLNLSINARDAMPKGGKILIETMNVSLDDETAATQNMQPGDYVVIALSDDGTGMSPETLDRVFEPFFTTKEVGKGTGLGLSMVYGFVRQSGGHVKIYSELGAGTTVKLYLPRARYPVADDGSAGQPHEPILHRGEHILVVEDDAMVRAYVATQLTKLGYKVTTANNGKDAIALLSGDGKFDLLFTDIVMPGSLTGRDVAEKAKELHPQIRVLFTSGYTQNAVIHHGRLDPGVQLLSKPYRLHQLAAKIREALD